MRDTQSPYRMRTANLLPKLESPTNPFTTPPKTEPTIPKVEPVVAVIEPVVAEIKPGPVTMETSFLFDAQLQPMAFAVPVKVTKSVLPAATARKPEPKRAKSRTR